MAINVSQAFHRTSANPVDESMALTKAQMLTVNDNLMPAYYLTICQDDGYIYLYDKSATPSAQTGKFKKFEGGGGGGTSDYSDLTNKPQINNVELSGNKSLSDLGINIPSATSDLTNDSGFITNLVNDLANYYKKTETYTQAEVDALISSIVTINIVAVNSLPTEDISTTTIYLVPKASAQTQNAKDEYINTDGTSAGWEKIGDTEIDLSNYVTNTSLSTTLADYIMKSQTAGLVKNDGTIDTSTYLKQVTSLPTASIDYLGQIVQYVGTTDTYIHGFFYECVFEDNAYLWKNIIVSDYTMTSGVEYDPITP